MTIINPLIARWVRRIFFRKTFDDIVSTHMGILGELESLNVRESRRMAREERRAARLKARAERRAKDMGRSNMLHSNWNVLMTQHIGVTPQETPAE